LFQPRGLYCSSLVLFGIDGGDEHGKGARVCLIIWWWVAVCVWVLWLWIAHGEDGMVVILNGRE
jgi:hypothetical protein